MNRFIVTRTSHLEIIIFPILIFARLLCARSLKSQEKFCRIATITTSRTQVRALASSMVQVCRGIPVSGSAGADKPNDCVFEGMAARVGSTTSAVHCGL
jgi:hypothetical protein